MKDEKTAHYKCLECDFEWFDKPGHVTCKCGCIWVKWLNYKDD